MISRKIKGGAEVVQDVNVQNSSKRSYNELHLMELRGAN